jgi:hypothetical protein
MIVTAFRGICRNLRRKPEQVYGVRGHVRALKSGDMSPQSKPRRELNRCRVGPPSRIYPRIARITRMIRNWSFCMINPYLCALLSVEIIVFCEDFHAAILATADQRA